MQLDGEAAAEEVSAHAVDNVDQLQQQQQQQLQQQHSTTATISFELTRHDRQHFGETTARIKDPAIIIAFSFNLACQSRNAANLASSLSQLANLQLDLNSNHLDSGITLSVVAVIVTLARPEKPKRGQKVGKGIQRDEEIEPPVVSSQLAVGGAQCLNGFKVPSKVDTYKSFDLVARTAAQPEHRGEWERRKEEDIVEKKEEEKEVRQQTTSGTLAH
ncbi:hypothetical protein ACLKA6_000203 [Drosophila palustris]